MTPEPDSGTTAGANSTKQGTTVGGCYSAGLSPKHVHCGQAPGDAPPGATLRETLVLG